MITRVEARNFRCLKSVNQELGPFHVLVGPNGSGKSAFLDVLSFVSTFVSEGLGKAVSDRTDNFHDLVWGGQGSCFELAIEALIQNVTFRYEVSFRIDAKSDEVQVVAERLGNPRSLILHRNKNEATLSSGVYAGSPPYRLHSQQSALSALPIESHDLALFFRERVQMVDLDSKALRVPSLPQKAATRLLDGSNTARLVASVQEGSPEEFERWVAHLKTTLLDLESIRTVSRPEDKKRYLMVKYANGVEAPSWVLSDGTLRLMALTILAYLPEKRVYLIEEPETGLHPQALETVYQSLSSVYGGQVLTTSHSPMLVALPKPEQLLCFRMTPEDATILRGDRHPALLDWRGEVDLGEYFAAGVLG